VSDTKAAELGSQYPQLQTALNYRRSKVGELPINFELFGHFSVFMLLYVSDLHILM
jgi:hypothetical protein